MKICTNCNNEFEKGKIISGNMGALWIIFIFLSMGLGFILWAVAGRKRKEVCPYCNSENIMEKEYYNGNIKELGINEKEPTNKELKKKKEFISVWDNFTSYIIGFIALLVIISTLILLFSWLTN